MALSFQEHSLMRTSVEQKREWEWMNSSGPLGKPGFAHHSIDATAQNLHLTCLPFWGGVEDL